MRGSHKYAVLAEYAHRYECTEFVETGTYKCGAIRSLLGHKELKLKEFWTIEAMEARYANAVQVFAPYPQVTCVYGRSEQQLPRVIQSLPTMGSRTLYWLDAHFVGTKSANREISCPLIDELRAIADLDNGEPVILIDDLRYFVPGDKYFESYPTKEDIIQKVNLWFPDYKWDEFWDIVRITP